jgi:DNA-binding NarL/FixJ family response regulator
MSVHVMPSRRQKQRRLAPPEERHVRVVIADHDGLARSMMRAALQDANGIATVATTGDGREALELVRYYQPAVLIIDTALLSDGPAALIGRVLRESPETRVLTISVNDDEIALSALRAGGVGHLSKDVDPAKLAGLVRRAASGEPIVPRRLTRPLLELLRELPDRGWRPLHSRLTTREWEIVELLGDGASTQEIAECLVLSPTTVYSHVKSLLRKLGVHSRREAVLAARRLRREEALGEKSTQPILSRSTPPMSSAREYSRSAGGVSGEQPDLGLGSPEWEETSRS